MEVLGLIDLPTWSVWLLAMIFIMVTLSIAYATYMCWDYGIFKKLGVNYVEPSLILGNFMEFKDKGIIDTQNEHYKKYGPVWGSFETCYPVLNVGDPELLKEIFVKQFHHFVNRRGFDNNDEPLDTNLTVIKDDQWRHVRNYITPTFSGKKLRHMTFLINGAADRLVKNLKPKVDNNEDIEIKETCGGYTMDVISCTAFGMQVDSQKNPNDPFVVHAKQIFEPNSFAMKYAMFVIFFAPFIMPILKFLRLPRGFPKSLTSFFQKVVDEALADRKREKDDPNKAMDFLQLMVQAEEEAKESSENTEDPTKRKGLTQKEIMAQAFLFFLAGYETTSSTLSFTMYMLSVKPECLEKAIQEVDDVLGDEIPTYDTVKKLNYIQMCIDESLRIYSIAPRVDRVANDDVVLGGIHIPKDMVVAIPISAIHMDPKYWDNPEKFDPERFTPEAKAKRDPYVYMPFGHGPRNCIGMRLALLESKISIARILQNFRVSKSPKTKEPVKPNKLGQLRVEGGLWVKMESRKKEE